MSAFEHPSSLVGVCKQEKTPFRRNKSVKNDGMVKAESKRKNEAAISWQVHGQGVPAQEDQSGLLDTTTF